MTVNELQERREKLRDEINAWLVEQYKINHESQSIHDDPWRAAPQYADYIRVCEDYFAAGGK